MVSDPVSHGRFSRYTHGPDENGMPGKGCRCELCRRANADNFMRRKNGLRAGTWQPYVDAAPARAHVLRLAEHGMTRAEVSRRSGIDQTTLHHLVGGSRQQKRLRPRTAAAILAVRVPRREKTANA